MPKSKSKRDTYIPPPKPKPKPSPRWVPMWGTGLIIAGIVVILLNYFGISPIGNWVIPVGFLFMAVGLGFLSFWR